MVDKIYLSMAAKILHFMLVSLKIHPQLQILKNCNLVKLSQERKEYLVILYHLKELCN